MQFILNIIPGKGIIMKKKVLRFISTALMAVMVTVALPAELAEAALEKVSSPAKVTTFKSSDSF